MSDRRSHFDYEDLLACGRGELFGPGNAQLPLPPMLMFDRIAEITETGGANGKGSVRAEFDIKPELWFFSCHFKGDPVMPGCLGLDALWQLTGFFLGLARPRWPGSRARRRRGQVRGSSFALGSQGRLRRRYKAHLQGKVEPRHRGWLAGGRRAAASTMSRTCGSGCSAPRSRTWPEAAASELGQKRGDSYEAGRRHRDGDRLFDRQQYAGSAGEPAFGAIRHLARREIRRTRLPEPGARRADPGRRKR